MPRATETVDLYGMFNIMAPGPAGALIENELYDVYKKHGRWCDMAVLDRIREAEFRMLDLKVRKILVP